MEDVVALINAVAAVGGAGPYSLVMSPGRAATFIGRIYRDRAQQAAPYDVHGTPAVGNDVVAIANAALVAAFSPDPDVETATAATLHMDSAPADIVGTGGAVAGPSQKSLFQTESVALKVRWPVSWALRNAAGVAWLTPVWK